MLIHLLQEIHTAQQRNPLSKKCPYSEFFSSVITRIQSKCGKILTRKTPNMDTFHTVTRRQIFFITTPWLRWYHLRADFQLFPSSETWISCPAIKGVIRSTSRDKQYQELSLETFKQHRWYRKLCCFFKLYKNK